MGRIKDLLIVDGPNRYPGKVPGAGRHRHKLAAVGDQRRGGSRADCTDELRDCQDSRGAPAANTPDESRPDKMSG
jgi:hypothetical protein